MVEIYTKDGDKHTFSNNVGLDTGQTYFIVITESNEHGICRTYIPKAEVSLMKDRRL